MTSPTHDHTTCCGPDSAHAARQYLTSQGEHSGRAYEWRRQLREQGYVQLLNGYDSRAMSDAILCERPAINAIALRWQIARSTREAEIERWLTSAEWEDRVRAGRGLPPR
jgi:hypothetical protein